VKTTIFLGPPGTGKTTRLLTEVDALFKQGYSPNEIAFVTFTKKGATEAAERALKKFDHLEADDFQWWRTIHSLCYRRLSLARNEVMQKQHWKELGELTGAPTKGYVNVEEGTVVGQEEGDRFLFHYGVAHAMKMDPKAYHEKLGWHTQGELHKAKFLYWCQQLTQYKKGLGLFDFADMLEQGAKIGPIPGVKVAIIDEAQDLSLRQWDVIRSAFQNVELCLIAGDDDQAIFEWGGADVGTFLNLPGDRITLDRSYRLPATVFNFGNKIIHRVKNRIEKVWGPDDREGVVQSAANVNYIAKLLEREAAVPDKDRWMILARNKYLLNELRSVIRAKGIPYSEKGVPAISPKDMRLIKAFVAIQNGEAISDSDARFLYASLKGNGKDIARGHKTLYDLPERVNREWLVQNGGYLVPESKQWWTTLNLPATKISYLRAVRRHGFSTSGDPKIQLNTIHAVKGGEAENVILFDGMASRTAQDFEDNPDAEHRVQYVGATRAKKRLLIYKGGDRNFYPFPATS
jgi:DNA helicase-2/ATP-dependent DNA helicase PcrA